MGEGTNTFWVDRGRIEKKAYPIYLRGASGGLLSRSHLGHLSSAAKLWLAPHSLCRFGFLYYLGKPGYNIPNATSMAVRGL